MRTSRKTCLRTTGASLAILVLAVVASAQPRGPQVVSPEVAQDGHVSFRILAPKAEAVLLSGADIPDNNTGTAMTKGDDGVWMIEVGPLAPGSYRYHLNVDGVSVVDPRNPATSESNENTWSLVHVPGADVMDAKDVPHGAVAEITYYSKSLKRFRRMHIYTPPGYAKGGETYPILYLLHGAFDCDDSWTTVGRAGFILDNLIAEGKAKPMVVAMPAGHTGPFAFGGPPPAMEEFAGDFHGDVMPYVESHYRVATDRDHRAIAGLSMGGAQTLGAMVKAPESFAYVGVFSSGVFGITGNGFGATTGKTWGVDNRETLAGPLRDGMKLLWFATGKDDFLIETTRATVAELKKHEFDVIYEETAGGHTWHNWREYLARFAPQLFQ